MYTDSHCHLNFPELQTNLGQIRQDMADIRMNIVVKVQGTQKP